jgi:hypothetical protein
MNTSYSLYTRPRRRWFVAVSVGVHVLALGLLTWWLLPDPVMHRDQTPATLNVTLAPADSEPAVSQLPLRQKTDVTVEAVVDPVVKGVEPAARIDAKTVSLAADSAVEDPTDILVTTARTDFYSQLLLSSRLQMERAFGVGPQTNTERLAALLNEPTSDGTLVGRLQSERNWAGTGETLVVLDTVFGTMCSRYTEADPLDSLDRGVWRMMLGGCYRSN